MTSNNIPLVYEDCDLPEDVTLVEWRRTRVLEARAENRREAEQRAARRAAKRRGAVERLRPRLPQPPLRIRPV